MRNVIFSLMLAIMTLAIADAVAERVQPGPARSLLERAVDAPVLMQEVRPTGQCIYVCGDRQIVLRRCPDGDCPEYDCQTGAATCRSR